jgi:glycyl-tRNA synthetase beta chain
MSAPLLVELFTEELPPKALQRLGAAFADGVCSGLSKARLVNADAKPQVYATPRRLAVLIPDVSPKAEDKLDSKKLMPAKVAFDAAGMPTTALTKRLEKDGASSNQLSRKTEGGNEFVYLSQTMPGVTLSAGLQGVLEDTIVKLPIPKVMSYQLPDSTETVRFVRPAHGLVALHGSEVVKVHALGLAAGRTAHGHRFLGARDIELKNADEYEARLRDDGKIIASFDTRRGKIDEQLRGKAAELGCTLGEYENLLNEVTALVEWPVVYVAGFDSEFLSVPQECLILTMRTNQKYFPLFDKAGKLTERFLVVSNMEVADPVNIIEGNKRVVRPRLADARFFYEQDRKVRLETRVPALGKVVYHNKLGTQLERVERIQLLAGKIARLIGANPLLAERAAWLAKADLQTGMVGEFPELQGIMGRYYAQHDEEPEAVSDAIEAHYRPRFSGDALPQGDVSCAVALADKLDTLAGLFGVGQQPTGEKDPFGLRRAALGVLRILIEQAYPIPLPELVNAAFDGHPRRIGDAHTDLEIFLLDRLAGLLRERKFSPQEIEAVLCLHPTRIDLVLPQLDAVRAFLALPEAPSLAAANKRVANILRQAAAKDESFVNANIAHFKEPAERALFDTLQSVSKSAHTLFNQGDFTGYLTTFAALKSPVDAFFDAVMVMVEDTDLRRNRLALLADLQAAMNRVADISKLAA